MDLAMITPIEQEKEALLLETEEAYVLAYEKAKGIHTSPVLMKMKTN